MKRAWYKFLILLCEIGQRFFHGMYKVVHGLITLCDKAIAWCLYG